MQKKSLSNPMKKELNSLASESVGFVRKNFSAIIPILLIGAVLAVGVVLFSTVVPLYNKAVKTGAETGAKSGEVIGTAVGNVEGAIEAVNHYEEMKYDELTSNDTTAEIANTIQTDVHSLGKLQVLDAEVAITDMHKVGDTYEALYLLRGHAIFTVNLNEMTVTVSPDEKEIALVLPQPTVQVNINHEKTEQLADWQKGFFNGSDEDGFIAYLSSLKQVRTATKEQIENYDMLLATATEFAVSHVRSIAKAACANKNLTITVTVQTT